jgi:NAD(P)-dependent dehydrogenase (short-subunit alcohol dehydrogenase family)
MDGRRAGIPRRMTSTSDPQQAEPTPPFPEQEQDPPGREADMQPLADHGEHTYVGHDRLRDQVALITGADSGIGRAVALAFAREGADILCSYWKEDEDEDAAETKQLVEEADFVFRTNIIAMFHLCQAAVPVMEPGSTIINTTSIQAADPTPSLLHYATTKGAISTFTKGLAQEVAERGIRVNAVAPGPIWTPLVAMSFPAEKNAHFGADTPLGRPGQPGELAPLYVFLATDDSRYISGEVIGATGGKPLH